MAKAMGGGLIDRQRIAERFKTFAAAHSLATLSSSLRLHRAIDLLHLVRDERMLDDVGVSRDRIRVPLGEAHWFYDKFR